MVRLFDRDDPAGRRTCNPGRFQDPLGRLRPVIGRVHCLRLVRVCRYQGLGQLQSSSVRLLVDLFAHNFWDMQGAARGANMAHFYKNLGIMGGFLLLALQGAGRYSADAQMSRSWLSRQMSRIGLSRG
jgi:hypothetical protein